MVCRILIWNKNNTKWWWGCSSHPRPFPYDPTQQFSARAPSPCFSKHSLSTLSNASSQLCKAQGKKFHPDHSRQSPYALKHEVWLPLSQFIIKSKTVAMNTGLELHLWNDTGQSAEISWVPFFFLNFCSLWKSLANWKTKASLALSRFYYLLHSPMS